MDDASDGMDSVARWSPRTWAAYKARGIGARVGFGARPAVLVVDMACAFTDPTHRVGCEQTPTVQAIARLLEVARAAAVPVFYTTLAFEPHARETSVWARKVPALLDLALSDPAAVEIDPRIAPRAGDVVVNKQFPSAVSHSLFTSVYVFAPPVPLSRISTTTLSEVVANSTLPSVASECLAALVRLSATT